MHIQAQALNVLKTVSIIFLFFWISFFAPLIGARYEFSFLFVIAILLLIFFVLDRNSHKLVFNKKDIPLWIFFLTMMAGLVNSVDPEVAYRHFWYCIFPAPFIYFFTKVAFQKRHGLFIIRALCFMALLVCVFGITEFITKQNFIYSYFVKNIYYDVFIGRRMISAHVHAVPLGTYLIAIFPLAVMLALKEKKPFFKFIYMINASIILISIILTFSRGAFLGVFAAISMMVVFLSSRKKMFFLALVLVIVIIFGYWSAAVCLNDISYDKSNVGNSLGFYRYSFHGLISRAAYFIPRFKMCAAVLKDHPFLGVGFGHYRVLFDHYLPDLAKITGYDCKVADSMFITLLAETGLAGFAGFILFISFLFKNIWYKLKLITGYGYNDRLLIVSFLSSFTGILCAFLTYDALYWIAPSCLFWAYSGILSSLSENV